MNKILPDTNTIPEIVLKRREFFEKSKELMLTINKLSIPTIIITRNIADFKKKYSLHLSLLVNYLKLNTASFNK